MNTDRAVAYLRPGRLSHPIHNPEFVAGWYSVIPAGNPDRLALCALCGDELIWHGADTWGNHHGETHCIPGQPQHHQPLPHPLSEDR